MDLEVAREALSLPYLRSSHPGQVKIGKSVNRIYSCRMECSYIRRIKPEEFETAHSCALWQTVHVEDTVIALRLDFVTEVIQPRFDDPVEWPRLAKKVINILSYHMGIQRCESEDLLPLVCLLIDSSYYAFNVAC